MERDARRCRKTFPQCFRIRLTPRRRVAIHICMERNSFSPKHLERPEKDIGMFNGIKTPQKQYGVFIDLITARHKYICVDADRHSYCVLESGNVRRGRGIADCVRKICSEARQDRTFFMIAPENHAFSEEPPKLPAKQHVFLVHMDEYRIIFIAEAPRVRIETK